MSSLSKLDWRNPMSVWIIPVLVVAILTSVPSITFGMQDDAKVTEPQVTAQDQLEESAKKMQAIVQALHTYHELDGHFPAASAGSGYDQNTNEWFRHRSNLSWRVSLLPFIGEAKLFEQFRHSEPWDSPHNQLLIDKMPAIYRSVGSKADTGYTNFMGVVGENTAFHQHHGVFVGDFEDGTVHTIILLEVSDKEAVPWTKPADFQPNENGPTPVSKIVGFREGGFLACTADSFPWFISDGVNADDLKGLFIRNDHEDYRINEMETIKPAITQVK